MREELKGLPAEIVETGHSGSAAIARDLGALGFGGRFLVFVDADVVVEANCIARLIGPIERGEAKATVGNYSKDVSGMSFASRYKQLHVARIYERRLGFVKNDYWTAVAASDANVFREVNGFDAGFRGACGKDGELGGRLTQNGYRILALPDAVGQHANALSVLKPVRNGWRKGLIAMRNHFRFDANISYNRHATRRDI